MDDWLDPFRALKRDAQVGVERLIQEVRFGRGSRKEMPRIYANAIPKCGSHLLYQFFEGLTDMAPLVIRHRYPIRPYTPKGRRRTEAEILHDLSRIRPGEIGWGYLFDEPAYLRILDGEGRVGFQLIRDPRDKIISQILYAVEIHEGHRMREYYLSELGSMGERISATIAGVDDPDFPLADIRTVYGRYRGWMQHPNAMLLRFEDLVQNRREALHQILDRLEGAGVKLRAGRDEAIVRLNERMSPERSATFRSGKTGSWDDHFTPENKRLFKQVAGDLLIELGYEEDYDW